MHLANSPDGCRAKYEVVFDIRESCYSKLIEIEVIRDGKLIHHGSHAIAAGVFRVGDSFSPEYDLGVIGAGPVVDFTRIKVFAVMHQELEEFQ